MIFDLFPFNLFRVPSRFLILVALGFTILSSLGIEKFIFLLNKKLSTNKINLIICFFIIISFIHLAVFFNSYHVFDLSKKWFEKPALIKFLKSKTQNSRIFSIGFESLWNEQFINKGWEEINPYFELRNNPINYANLYYSLSQFSIISAMPQKREALINNFINENIHIDAENKKTLISSNFQKFLSLQSIEYLILPHPLEKEYSFEKILTPKNNNKFYVYRNSRFLPLVRISNDYQIIKTFEDFKKALSQPEFDPAKTILLEKDPLLTPAENNNSTQTIKIQKFENQQIEIDLDLKQKGLLLVSSYFYPGWKAFVDGEEREILAANLNQRAIQIEQGTHKVKFIYQPKSFKVGAIISGITFIIIIFFLLGFPFLSSFLDRVARIL